MTDRTLFDPDKTTDRVCPVCTELVVADEDKSDHCPHDLLVGMGMPDGYRTRPKGCLNAHDPAHAPFPEGF